MCVCACVCSICLFVSIRSMKELEWDLMESRNAAEFSGSAPERWCYFRHADNTVVYLLLPHPIVLSNPQGSVTE